MGVTPQLVFMVLGVIAFLAAAVLAVIAVRYFLSNDIRSVMDDLSGRSRQASGSTGGVLRNRRARFTGRWDSPSVSAGGVSSESQSVRPSNEDELDTVIDTKLRQIVATQDEIKNDKWDGSDDVATVVTSTDGYHQDNKAKLNEGDADVPTGVDQDGQDMPTEVDRGCGVDGSSFVVTRNIEVIHSNEVIAAR